jgi:hypothetical protein
MTFARAIVLSLLFATMLAGQAPAQTTVSAPYPRVETKVDPTSGTVGDKFRLTISATVPNLSALQVLPLFDTQTTWTVTGDPVISESGKAGHQTRTFAYTIVPFETGRQAVPQVAVTYAPAGATSNTVQSKALWVQIDSVLSGDGSASTLRDVKPPLALPVPKAVVWSVSIFAFVLLALLGWWLWRRYSARLRKMLGQALTPPDLALKKIAALESERLIEHKKMKELYTRLTDAVRVYLHEAYGVQALDLTSNELLDAMDRKAEEESPRHLENYRKAMARLVEVLTEADMVKFARFVPEQSQSRRAIQAARDVINFTRYRFEPDEDEQQTRGRKERGAQPRPPKTGPPPPPMPQHVGVYENLASDNAADARAAR